MDESVIRNTFVDLDKRITELERLFPMMSERLKMYDQIINDFKALDEDFTNVKTYLSSQDSKFTSIFQDHDSKISQNNAKSTNLSNDLYNLRQEVAALTKNHADIENSLSKVNDNNLRAQTSIDTLKSMIDFVRNSCASSQDLQTHKDNLENFLSSITTSLANVKQSVNDTDRKINETTTATKALLDSHTDLISKVSTLSDNHQVLSQDKASKSDVLDTVKASSNDLRAFTEKVLNEFASKIPSINLDDLQKDFQSKFDFASQDSSNAIMMARNSAKQILTLEKKVEGIVLQLKSFELK